MATSLGQLGSGTFGAFSAQDLAPPKPKAPKSLDEQLVESAEAEASMVKEKEKGQAQEKAILAKGEETLAKETAEKMRTSPTRALIEQKTIERADKKFVPNQETAGDLGTLFTITNLMGFMIGGRGKGNATAALSAMNGMLEGHQKGRQDLYNKEKAVYDENIKTLDKTIDSLYKKMQDDMQLYSADNAAGMAALRTTMAQHDAKLAQNILEKYGPVKSFQTVKTLVDIRDKRKAAEAALAEKELARVDKIEKEKRDREFKLQLAQIAAEAKKSKEEGQTTDLGHPDINSVFQLGVPVAIQNPYRGLTEKLKGAAFTSELKKAEKDFETNSAATGKAQKTIDSMTQADDILKRISTGKIARLPFGESVQTALSSDAARFDSIAKDMARNAYVKGEGALSDMERKMFEKASISLGNPTATNKQIIDVTKAIAERTIEHNKYAERYFAANKTLMGSEENWSKYLLDNPLFTRDSTESNIKLNSAVKPYTQYFQEEIRRAVSGQ
jgi:hypothetical protein